jgi:predicted outer membrane repeat protein
MSSPRRIGLCLLALTLVLAANVDAATIHVDVAATPGGNGQSWATAFTSLQAALDVALGGDEIRIAQGTYLPTKRLDINNPRTATFSLEVPLTLRGGYAGAGNSDPTVRDFTLYLTILSGDLNGDDDHSKAPNDPARHNSENAYQVIDNNYNNSFTTLDGLKIVDGNATGTWPKSSGGAIFFSNSAAITDCRFEYNTSDFSGGAIYTNSPLIIVRCRFLKNASLNYNGGAIFTQGSDTRVESCSFFGNSAYEAGAMMGSWAGGQQLFMNCVFSGNSAVGEGGALYMRLTSPKVINCTFSSNSAANGGAINNYSSSPAITNNVLWGNTGGQIASDTNSFPVITYCDIQGWASGGTGNISSDPMFVDADGPDNIAGTYDDDLRLQANSPATDAGNNAAVPADIITDLSGNRRFDDDVGVVDTGNGTGAIVDLGAFERAFRPSAIGDSATTLHGHSVNVPVLNNDVTFNGGTLSITGITQGSNGSVTIQGNAVSYLPNTSFSGSDSFTYTLSAGTGQPDIGTVQISVTNTSPQSNSQSVSTHWGTALPITLGGSDGDNDALTYAIVQAQSHGTITGTAPNLTYTPTGNYVGQDTFTFKTNDGVADSNIATITIDVTNTVPTASNQSVSTHWGTALPVTLGGSDADNDTFSFAIVQAQSHGTLTGAAPNLTYTPTGTYVGQDTFTFKTNDGVADSNTATITVDVTNTAPASANQSVATHWGTAQSITLGASDADNDPLTFAVASQPQHGTLTGTAPNLSYTATVGYVGDDSFTFKANDGIADSALATVSISVTNAPPSAFGEASPTSVVPAGAVSFTGSGVDRDNDPLTFFWDFGDNQFSSDQNPVHSYANVGVYVATVFVNDPAGEVSKAFVTIQVSKAPVVRLQTSDVVGFGGLPFTFDASTSTDSENSIASYDWDFGDGTPHGAGQVISKVYDLPGTYTITLTITDSAGVSSSLQRIIEVLPGNEVGLFNGFMKYKVAWNRSTENKDSLNFEASVNVGDDVVGNGTAVALEIVGQRFTGTLDRKLRDYSDADQKWQVKAGIRKQPSGSVSLKVTIKKASLGLGFNQAGATAGADPHDIVSVSIPVHLEIGGHSFEMLVPTDFKFSGGGTRAKGDGESE